MPSDASILRQLCVWLFGRHKPSRYSGDEAALFSTVSGTYKPFRNDYEIEQHFNEAVGNIDFGDKFIYLKPLTKRGMYLPAMQIKYEQGAKPKWSFYLVVFSIGVNSPNSIGFRYESPEGEGRHHCFHMQLVSQLFGFSASLPGCPVWLPTSDPLFPIDADSPVKLFLCLVLSLYGASSLYGIPASVPAFANEIEQSLTSMHFMRVMPLYFKISSGRTTTGVRANKLQAPKLKQFAKLNKDLTVTDIASQDFYSLKPNQQIEYDDFVATFSSGAPKAKVNAGKSKKKT